MDHNEHDETGAGVPGPDDDATPHSHEAVEGTGVEGPGDAGDISGSEPAALDPMAMEPAALDPEAMEPAAIDPYATEPAVIDPYATEPAVIDPYATEPGSVAPIAPSGVISPDGGDAGGGGSRKRLLVIGAVVVAVLAIGAAAFAVVQARLGSAEDALVAIPADAAFVVSVDLRHFTEGDRFDRLVAAIEPIAAESGSEIETFDDAVAEIDATLQEELGVTLTDDVLPWVGRSMAISLDGIDVESGEPEGLVFAMSVRDEEAATEFIEKLAAEQDAELERVTVEGASAEAYNLGESDAPGWLLVEDGMLLLTVDEATLERSLATMESGNGIADDEDYRALIDELPEDRGFRMFLDGDAFNELIGQAEVALEEELGSEGATGLEDFEIADVAIAAGLTDVGIAFDMVTAANPEFGTIVAPPLAAELPADALFYLGFGVETDPPTIGGLIREADQEMYDQVGDFGREFLGIDSLGELLDHLTPEVGLALTPLRGAMPMAGAIPFDISAILSLGIDDRDAVVGIVGDIVDWLASAGITVEETDGVWQVLIDPQAPPLLAWTVTDDSLRIATDLGVLDQFAGTAEGDDTTETTADGDADSEDAAPDDFAALDEALPGDGLNLYVDIDGLADAFAPDEDEARVFSGFDAIAAGIEQRDDIQHYGMIIKLSDPDEEGVDALQR